MKHKLLEIDVAGDVGTGKSHVLATIEKALIAEYGTEVSVVSHDLRNERALVGTDEDMTRPGTRTIFALSESPRQEIYGDRRLPVDVPARRDPPSFVPSKWKNGWLHVVGTTYIALSPGAVLEALNHAQDEVNFGSWQGLTNVNDHMPGIFPSVISFTYEVGASNVRLIKMDHSPYPQLFADLTGEECCGYQPKG